MSDKPIEKWTDRDFWREAKRMTGSDNADENLCASVMLAAVVEGANRDRIAKRLRVDVEDFGWMFDNLTKSRVFRKDGKVYANWGDPKDGGLEFCLDVAVGLGLLAKTKGKPKPKSRKVGAK